MTSSQRIILNTLATYGRTVFGMALGLFSSRWVLQSLGSVDYGLMAVVGGLITFVTMLNGVTSSSCARFFALSIGQGNSEETNRWFNTALSIHTILPLILVAIALPIGEWLIGFFLNIPPERLMTARWVFRFSLISAFIGMCSTPYVAMYTAKQNIAELSLFGILSTLCNFFFIYWLTTYKGDVWLVYAGWTVGIAVLIEMGQVVRAWMIFPECRIRFSLWYERKRLLEVFSFAGWNLVGVVGAVLRGQFVAVLLNKKFNPIQFGYVNASYSLGTTVTGYTQSLAAAMLGAFSPEITATEGRGDRTRVFRLANKASKFGALLTLFFTLPLLLEINYVLKLWLINPPRLAALFCSYSLIQFLIDKVAFGHMYAVMASGKIAVYQIVSTLNSGLAFLLSWFFLSLGFSPASVGVAFIMTTGGFLVFRLFWARRILGFPPSDWFKQVGLPCLYVIVPVFLVGKGVQMMFSEPSFIRLSVVTVMMTVFFTASSWFFALESSERIFIRSHCGRLKTKVGW